MLPTIKDHLLLRHARGSLIDSLTDLTRERLFLPRTHLVTVSEILAALQSIFLEMARIEADEFDVPYYAPSGTLFERCQTPVPLAERILKNLVYLAAHDDDRLLDLLKNQVLDISSTQWREVFQLFDRRLKSRQTRRTDRQRAELAVYLICHLGENLSQFRSYEDWIRSYDSNPEIDDLLNDPFALYLYVIYEHYRAHPNDFRLRRNIL